MFSGLSIDLTTWEFLKLVLRMEKSHFTKRQEKKSLETWEREGIVEPLSRTFPTPKNSEVLCMSTTNPLQMQG